MEKFGNELEGVVCMPKTSRKPLNLSIASPTNDFTT
jgi:hypothetical protein